MVRHLFSHCLPVRPFVYRSTDRPTDRPTLADRAWPRASLSLSICISVSLSFLCVYEKSAFALFAASDIDIPTSCLKPVLAPSFQLLLSVGYWGWRLKPGECTGYRNSPAQQSNQLTNQPIEMNIMCAMHFSVAGCAEFQQMNEPTREGDHANDRPGCLNIRKCCQEPGEEYAGKSALARVHVLMTVGRNSDVLDWAPESTSTDGRACR